MSIKTGSLIIYLPELRKKTAEDDQQKDVSFHHADSSSIQF